MSHIYATDEVVSVGRRPVVLVELLRRLVLVVGVLGAVWCALSPAPVVIRLSSVDFAKEQKQSGRTAADLAARAKSLTGIVVTDEELGSGARLPLDEFIARSIKDRIVVVSGGAWEKLCADVKATETGQSNALLKHLGYNMGENCFYFAGDVAPAAEVLAKLPKGETFTYVKLSGGSANLYLSAVVQGPSDGSRHAPTWIMYPLRPMTAWLAAAGILIYAFLPWPRPSRNVLMYSGPRAVVVPDMLGMVMGAFFFALPLLIVADNSSSLGTSPLFDFSGAGWGWLTVMMWGLAALCLSINVVALWYGTSSLEIADDALAAVNVFGTRRLPWDQIESAEGVAFRSPRWLRMLMMFGAMLSPRHAGAMILGATSEGWGMQMKLRDGRARKVMLSHLPGAARVVTRMVEHGTRVSADLKASLPDDPYDTERGRRPSHTGRAIGISLALMAVAAVLTWHYMPAEPARLTQPAKPEISPEQVDRQEAALKEIAALRAKMKTLMAQIDAAPVGKRKEMLKEYQGYLEQVQKLADEFSAEK